jgi:hypothetical protein
METIAQTISLSAGDVHALEVYRQDGHLIGDRGSDTVTCHLTTDETLGDRARNARTSAGVAG